MTIIGTKALTWDEIFEKFNEFTLKWYGESPITRDREALNGQPYWGSAGHERHVTMNVASDANRSHNNEMLYVLIHSDPDSSEFLQAKEAVQRGVEIAHDAFGIMAHVMAQNLGNVTEISEVTLAWTRDYISVF